MLSIREIVQKITEADYGAREGMARGIINLSQYARTIQGVVAEQTKKEVGVQSIVVTLARLEKTYRAQQKPRAVEVRQLAVQSPIVQFVYPKNKETLNALSSVIEKTSALDDMFFSFSSSTKDIALIVTEKLERAISESFQNPPLIKKRGLSAVNIKFDETLVAEANVGLILLQKLAAKNIVLDAALTTYNEFTLVFESRYLHDAIEALNETKTVQM